jgi:hypothetical protein
MQYNKFCSESVKGRDPLENLHVDGRIILKRKRNIVGWCGLSSCASE